jgi:flagellar hook-basal body complex protein FliE
MNGIEAIAAVANGEAPLALRISSVSVQPAPIANTGFGDILMAGLRGVDSTIATADKLVQQFAMDDSVPVHQVTMALEEARLSVELAMQVRARLVEGYRELMNMPL